MQRVGIDISAKDKWSDAASSYAESIGGGYHQHRLAVIDALLPPLRGHVVDYGCGEGVLCERALSEGATVTGTDIERSLLTRAAIRVPSARYLHGGVEQLAKIDKADLIIAANVLAYMTPKDEEKFYQESSRLISKGGHLVVTHSNALFDMFTFNAYTVGFYKANFGVDPSPLLVSPEKPDRTSFSIRENPLTYTDKLRAYGFEVEQVEYMNLHSAPPMMLEQDPDDMNRHMVDTLNVQDKWKLMFQCSMFGVRARRT